MPWRTTIADPAARRTPDLVRSAERPDALWLADFAIAARSTPILY